MRLTASIIISLCFAGSAQAALLYDSGLPAVASVNCDGEGCGGGGEWTVVDDFTASADWNINALTFFSAPTAPATFNDYISTTWSIWDSSDLLAAPLLTGSAVANITQISGADYGWYKFTLDGLDVDLTAGNYWLGYHHDFTTERVTTTVLASESGNFSVIGPLFPGGDLQEFGGTGTVALGIQGSVVPIPAAVWLFGSALAGLGWIRRRQSPSGR